MAILAKLLSCGSKGGARKETRVFLYQEAVTVVIRWTVKCSCALEKRQ